MRRVRDAAYRASIELAREKGAFPRFDADAFLASGFALAAAGGHPRRDRRARHPQQSSCWPSRRRARSACSANNVSSGIEPVFAAEAERRVLGTDGRYTVHRVDDYACRLWKRLGRNGLPPAMVEARQLDPRAHLLMQAALQPCVDNAISKTINVAAELPFEPFQDLYREAHALGLKGCTVFRPNPVTGAILSQTPNGEQVPCCGIEREAD